MKNFSTHLSQIFPLYLMKHQTERQKLQNLREEASFCQPATAFTHERKFCGGLFASKARIFVNGLNRKWVKQNCTTWYVHSVLSHVCLRPVDLWFISGVGMYATDCTIAVKTSFIFHILIKYSVSVNERTKMG